MFRLSFPIVFGCFLAGPASAQVGTCWMTWEISTDLGATWRTGVVEAEQSQSSALVRVRIGFSQDAGFRFHRTAFDGVVTASVNDQFRDISRGDLFYIGGGIPIVPVRWNGLTKLENDPGDAMAPGMGSAWLTVGNPTLSLNGDNPIRVLAFRMDLDGAPGDRMFSQVFDPSIGTAEARIAFARESSPGVFMTNYPTMTVQGATLRIVPAPALGILPAGAAFAAFSRRRYR